LEKEKSKMSQKESRILFLEGQRKEGLAREERFAAQIKQLMMEKSSLDSRSEDLQARKDKDGEQVQFLQRQISELTTTYESRGREDLEKLQAKYNTLLEEKDKEILRIQKDLDESRRDNDDMLDLNDVTMGQEDMFVMKSQKPKKIEKWKNYKTIAK